jgi:hypothetical protein
LKSRLRPAVDTGKFDVTVAIIGADNQCEFGKWLYGADFSAAEKQTQCFRTAVDLHAKFHREAARVVELATSGHKDQANAAMGLQGSYTKASSCPHERIGTVAPGVELTEFSRLLWIALGKTLRPDH